jgi:hypothetical protein
MKTITIRKDERYGQWSVIGEARVRDKWGARFLRVRCDCGTRGLVRINNLRQGLSLSCGKSRHRKWEASQ